MSFFSWYMESPQDGHTMVDLEVDAYLNVKRPKNDWNVSIKLPTTSDSKFRPYVLSGLLKEKSFCTISLFKDNEKTYLILKPSDKKSHFKNYSHISSFIEFRGSGISFVPTVERDQVPVHVYALVCNDGGQFLAFDVSFLTAKQPVDSGYEDLIGQLFMAEGKAK